MRRVLLVVLIAMGMLTVNPVASSHRADTDTNNRIDISELIAFIDLWYANSTEVPAVELAEAIDLWKSPPNCTDLGGTVCSSLQTCSGFWIDESDSCCGGECVLLCADDDGDGYGSPASDHCTYSELDCNDGNASINPGVVEICDGIDNNCDSSIDEGMSGCCSGVTVDLQTDEGNCGGCGIVCSGSEECVGGACQEIYYDGEETHVFALSSSSDAGGHDSGSSFCSAKGLTCVGTSWLYNDGCTNGGYCGFGTPDAVWKSYSCGIGGLTSSAYSGSAKKVYCDGVCSLTCSEQGEIVCTSSQTCSGSVIDAFDSNSCCKGECVNVLTNKHIVYASAYRTYDGATNEYLDLGHYDFYDNNYVVIKSFHYVPDDNSLASSDKHHNEMTGLPDDYGSGDCEPGLIYFPGGYEFDTSYGSWWIEGDLLKILTGGVVHEWQLEDFDEGFYKLNKYYDSSSGSSVIDGKTFGNFIGYGYVSDSVILDTDITRSNLLDSYGSGEMWQNNEDATSAWNYHEVGLSTYVFTSDSDPDVWGYPHESSIITGMWCMSTLLLNYASYTKLLIYYNGGHDYNENGCMDETDHQIQIFGIMEDSMITKMVFIEQSYETDGYPIISVGRYYN